MMLAFMYRAMLIWNIIVTNSLAEFIPQFKWSVYDSSFNSSNLYTLKTPKNFLASTIVGHPVYVSIATISERVDELSHTIESIIDGYIVPTSIFIFVSSEPMLKDRGIPRRSLPKALVALTKNKPIYIIYTDNIGPHRKLLPILAKYWGSNCAIITLDDDVIYPKNTVSELVKYYLLSNKDSVVALRSHRIGFCVDKSTLKMVDYKMWPIIEYGIREMLELPTGTGGVLYRPDFFHPIVFDKELLHLTKTGDDILFRMSCMLKDVSVVTACRLAEDVRKCPISTVLKSPGGEERLSGTSSVKKRRNMRQRLIDREHIHNDTAYSTPATSEDHVFGNLTYDRVHHYTHDLQYNSKHAHNSHGSAVDDVKDKDDEVRQRRLSVSLWSENKKGKNNKMWEEAEQYMATALGIDFMKIYRYYFYRERKACMSSDQHSRCAVYSCGKGHRRIGTSSSSAPSSLSSDPTASSM